MSGYLGVPLDLVQHNLHARAQIGLPTRSPALAWALLVPQSASFVALRKSFFTSTFRCFLLVLLLLRRGIKVRKFLLGSGFGRCPLALVFLGHTLEQVILGVLGSKATQILSSFLIIFFIVLRRGWSSFLLEQFVVCFLYFGLMN